MIYDLLNFGNPELAGMAFLPAAWSGMVVGNQFYVVTTFQGLYIYLMRK